MTRQRSSPEFNLRVRPRPPRRSRAPIAAPTAQLALPLSRGWGGQRAGAGRPAHPGRQRAPHSLRPAHHREHPVHVTLRSACRSLRTQFVFPTVRAAISAANRRAPELFRVVHFSIQADHMHLLVEARDRAALIEGVRGFSIRVARRVNRLLFRRGQFFADRWHGRALTSPRTVRHALVYVIANFRKHECGPTSLLDAFSSAPYCRDFDEFPSGSPLEYSAHWLPRALAPPDELPILPATTWLLSTGWQRHGKLSVKERPAG